MSSWDIGLNEEMRRRDVQDRWGGQRQGGIATPRNSENILIFTNPSAGKKYGYDLHEGLREDGSYAYTGEGQVGNQVFLRGNKALLDSAENGKTIRLFRATGSWVTYVGAFALGDPGYRIERTLDVEGSPRNAIIFNLIPLDADERLLPTYGGINATSSKTKPWSAPGWEEYQITQTSKGDESTTASRAEFKLQGDFGEWRQAQGHVMSRLILRVGNSFISPDLFDETTSELFEAKKSSGRGYVRTAIGQVLDYQNNARTVGLTVKPCILLPGAPPADLIALCEGLGISIYVPDDNSDFRML